MIITFCGHSDFSPSIAMEEKLLAILETNVGEEKTDFYLGGYGNFDSFAFKMGKIYQRTHPNVSLVYVTPYFCDPHLKEKAQAYDSILYPPLENVPPKFAISHRNKYMVENSDLVIAFISRKHGGAYQTYAHAQKKGRTIVNLAELTRGSGVTEQEILTFDPTIHSTMYFARHVLCYLREHMDLLTQADYRHLYDETLDYLAEYVAIRNKRGSFDMTEERNFTEFYIDLVNKYADESFEKFSEELIEKYIAYRRKFW